MIHWQPLSGPSARRALFLAVVSLFFLLGGCGKKTPPVPPQVLQPHPVNDLRYRVDGKDALISWSYPTHALNGTPLTHIEQFDLERAAIPADEYCDGCPVPFGPPVTISGGTLPDTGGRIAQYREKNIQPGTIYFYRVRSRINRWFASQPSATLSFTHDIAPAAVTGVAASAYASMTRIAWSPVTTRTDGTPMTDAPVYQIFRKEQGKPYALLADKIPPYVTTYWDAEVTNGRTYTYQVRALRRVRKTRLAGAFSKPVEATPVDRTPPAAPQSVTAFWSPEGVRIMWISPSTDDIAGYRIYRRPAKGKNEMIESLPGTANEYLDSGPFLGSSRWIYTVTALDGAPQPNESKPSPEALVDVPE